MATKADIIKKLKKLKIEFNPEANAKDLAAFLKEKENEIAEKKAAEKAAMILKEAREAKAQILTAAEQQSKEILEQANREAQAMIEAGKKQAQENKTAIAQQMQQQKRIPGNRAAQPVKPRKA